MLAGAAAGVGSLAAGSAVLAFGTPLLVVLLALTGLTVLVLACVLAAYRFDVFVVVLLLVRPSLDRLPLRLGQLDVSSLLALLFLVGGTVWLVVRARQDPMRFSAMSTALVAFAGVAALSTLASTQPLTSAVAVSKTASGVLMFLVLERLLRDEPGRVRPLVTAVLASAVVPCLTALGQAATGDYFISSGESTQRVIGTFIHPNPFATYLALVLVLACAVLAHVERRVEQAFVLGIVALSGVCLLLTFSRGGWIAAMVGLAYLLGKRSKLLLVLAALGAVLAVATVPPVQARLADIGAPPPVEGVPANSLEWRVGYWQDVLPLAADSPIIGIGLEGVQSTTSSRLPPHNAYVQTYVETGLLGLLALLSVILTGWVALRARARSSLRGPDHGLALAATAVALGVLAQTLTENLLTQTMALWFFAAAATWGHVRSARETEPLRLTLRGMRTPAADGATATGVGRR